MLDDSTTKCKIEDRHEKMDKDPDETVYDGYDVEVNIEEPSYGEQSITDDRNNVMRTHHQEFTKLREILEQTESMMKKA